MDADEPQLRHLRDILGAYARQVLGWYSIADDRDDDEDDAGGRFSQPRRTDLRYRERPLRQTPSRVPSSVVPRCYSSLK